MENGLEFLIEGRDGRARAGVIRTAHGEIATPAFMVVGTKGEVRNIGMDDLREVGAQGMLSNAYHLRRKAPEIAEGGGLAEWSGWGGPTMTDSGGFQVMSLGSGLGKVVSMEKMEAGQGRQTPHKERLAVVSEEGVDFVDPFDGMRETMTPESSMEVQWNIGSDIHMAFDELTSIGDSYEYNVEAMGRTHRWAERCLRRHAELRGITEYPQYLYGVLQGGHYEDLRRETARWMGERGFDGYGIGGAFTKEDLGKILQWVEEELPDGKPRHLLGLSRPDDIFVGARNGVDTFDCVAPTREARHGRIYTMDGDINLRKGVYAGDSSLLDDGCDCATCRAEWTRAELRELMKSQYLPPQLRTTREKAAKAGIEISPDAYRRLASIHNVRFVVRLCGQVREAILEGRLEGFEREFMGRYRGF